MRVFGTTVRNPTRRAFSDGYSQCNWCKKWYTSLGVARHWSKCPVKKQKLKEQEIARQTFYKDLEELKKDLKNEPSKLDTNTRSNQQA